MKNWQHGYELEYLKEVESQYADYNKYTLSPFAKFKKNNVAESLHKGTLILLDDAMLEMTKSKVSSKISMHGDTVIARKQKDDITIGKIVGNLNAVKNYIETLESSPIWLFVWAEDESHVKFAEENGFEYIGPKITTYGEVHSIYYKGEERERISVDPAEYLSIKKVEDVNASLIETIENKLKNLPEFTNHYSNYNKKKSWSALSLRGYSDDPSFITNPVEMNDKWKKEHEGNEYFLQDTSMYDQFPEVREILKDFGDVVHRVRFMRLKPGGGELERHTDQVDPDSGGSMGKVARLHFPIKTNENVIFTVWDTKGKKQEVHMKAGECWFLDTRKPHMAVNNGDEERIHLVVDIETEGKLYDKLIG